MVYGTSSPASPGAVSRGAQAARGVRRTLAAIALLAVCGCGAVRAPAPPVLPPIRLLVADPRTDAVAAANTYDALFPLIAAASTAVDADNVGGRIADLAVTSAVAIPWLLVHHEFGHYRVADRLGGDPHIDFDDWSVDPRFPPGLVLSAEDELEFLGAGVGQSTLAAQTVYLDWARAGSCSSQQALGLGFAAVDLTRYSARTVLRGIDPGDDPGDDDVANYVETFGGSLRASDVLWMSAVANLASAPLWSAAAAQVLFAADGARAVAMPTMNVGDLEFAAPWFSLWLARRGPIASMTSLLGTNRKLPLLVQLEVGTHTSTGSLGAALLGAMLGSVELAPFARASLGTDADVGTAFGIEAVLPLGRGCATGCELSYRHADLRSEIDGCFDGGTFRLWIELRL